MVFFSHIEGRPGRRNRATPLSSMIPFFYIFSLTVNGCFENDVHFPAPNLPIHIGHLHLVMKYFYSLPE
jgi:hypothetical protein